MRKTETRTTTTFPEDTGLNLLLTEARMEERRGRAEVFAVRLEKLAVYITGNKLSSLEAAELLCSTAETLRHQSQEIR